MSTSSERALRAAAAATNAGNNASERVVINPSADRTQRLAAVEATAT